MKNLITTFQLLFVLSFATFGQTDWKSQTFSAKKEPNAVTKIIQSKQDYHTYSAKTGSNFSLLIPPGEALIFKYNNQSAELEQYFIPEYQYLTDLSKQAIAKAPAWLRNDLRLVLIQLSETHQNKWANAILETQDPYIDEVAFCISAFSVEYLRSEYAYPEMLRINAEYIYKYDKLFKYVEVIDHGTSADDDYYSTTSYKMINESGVEVTKEIPKEIYYWFVVNPQITDEIPGFVKTEVHELNAKDVMTTPEKGQFWRAYLFEHHDKNIPNLNFGAYTASVEESAKLSAVRNGRPQQEYEGLAQNILDSLQTVPVYWDSKVLGVNSPQMLESYGVNNVLALLNRYTWSCMRFWSVSAVERPHQPVRIIKWGMGRCGEHSDLTTALGRTALIPTCNVEGLSSDHTWNAFYDPLTNSKSFGYNIDNWKVWETTITGFVNSYINHDKDGDRWASVNLMRSDGVSYPIVEKYSNKYGKLTITAEDSNGNPIDGAHVVLVAQQAASVGENLFFDNAGTTDQNGQVEFIVGDQRIYYAKVYAQGQEVPQETGIVTNVTDGEPVENGVNYGTTFTFENLKLSRINKIPKDTIYQNLSKNKLALNIYSNKEIALGSYMYNDLSSTSWFGTQYRDYKETNPNFTVFQCDDRNIGRYNAGNSFTALNNTNQSELNTTFDLPENDIFYVIRNNNQSNFIQLEGNIGIQDASGNEIYNFIPDNEGGKEFETYLNTPDIENNSIVIYPNPTSDYLFVNANDIQKIRIYNSCGQLVIENNINKNSARIDLSNLKSGIYFISIIRQNTTTNSKIIVEN